MLRPICLLRIDWSCFFGGRLIGWSIPLCRMVTDGVKDVFIFFVLKKTFYSIGLLVKDYRIL